MQEKNYFRFPFGHSPVPVPKSSLCWHWSNFYLSMKWKNSSNHNFIKISLFQVPVWSFSSAGAKIIHMLAKPTEEVVHSQGRVMADRSVLFKYINPNLAFVLAEGQDTTGKGFVNIYLLDLVTGRIIFSANHRRVQVW